MLKESYLSAMKNLSKDSIKIIVTRSAGSKLSPSWQLLKDYKCGKIDWNGYVKRFKTEMDNESCIAEMKQIKEIAKSRQVYLICYEKKYPCHRFLLIDMINSLE
jgi:uncharacterized protein YeaO (DUF488 family)